MLDGERIKKAREGDFKSLEEICSSTWESVYRFIYFKVQNREEAEDLTQETYVKALSYMQKDNIRIDNYIGLLKTISLNILRDKWRKSKRRGTYVDFEAINPVDASIDDHTEISAQRELVKSALNRLSEEQRTIIELRIIYGYSAAETAKIMNKKAGTIRVIQYRALQALAEILGNNG